MAPVPAGGPTCQSQSCAVSQAGSEGVSRSREVVDPSEILVKWQASNRTYPLVFLHTVLACIMARPTSKDN
jgi:hypothetical protein